MTHTPAPATALAAALAAVAVPAITGCAALRPAPPAPPHRPPPAAACPRTPPPAATQAGASGLLPFTPAQLRAAAALAGTFTSYYGATGQPPGRRLARLRPLATRHLYAALAQGAATSPRGPAATARVTGEQVRDLSPGSVTLTVTTTSSTGQPAAWAVTAVPAGRGWLVYDIEPAAAGNTGAGQ